MTRAGLTFSTMPRSTNQTSPRSGAFFLLVKHLECNARALLNILVRQRLAVKPGGSRGGRLPNGLPQFPQKRLLVAYLSSI
jgi:hypothetical protein